MAVLSKREIIRRLDLDPWDPKGLVVTPLLDEKSVFDTDSIDLRLGTQFLLPRLASSREAHLSRGETSSSAYVVLNVPLSRYLVIPAHQTVLGATLEFIKLPHDVAGEILTKSSLARTFTLIETAPWIHPYYRGCLTLEIANVSNTPLLLYPGTRIGQMVLLKAEPAPEVDGQLKGSYFGPVYPEGPKGKTPIRELIDIGVKRPWIIPAPRRSSGDE